MSVDDLHVAESRRGRGIGTALLEESYRWARERGADRTVLQVMAANQAARAFYSRQSFETVDLKLRKVL